MERMNSLRILAFESSFPAFNTHKSVNVVQNHFIGQKTFVF